MYDRPSSCWVRLALHLVAADIAWTNRGRSRPLHRPPPEHGKASVILLCRSMALLCATLGLAATIGAVANPSVLVTTPCAGIACVLDSAGHPIQTITSSDAMADGSLDGVPIARVERLPNVPAVVLRDNGMTSFGDFSVDEVGRQLHLLELSLVNQAFHALGSNFALPTTLQRLNLSGTPLQSIHNVTFPPSLGSLDLSHARLLDIAVSPASFGVLATLSTVGHNVSITLPPTCNGTVQSLLGGTLNVCVLASQSAPSTFGVAPATTTTVVPPTPTDVYTVSTSSGGDTSATATSIALGVAIALVVVVLVVLLRRARRDQSDHMDTVYKRQTTRGSIVSEHDVRFDASIASWRLPRTDIQLRRLVSTDAMGGRYDGVWTPTQMPVVVRQLQTGADMDRFMQEIRLCTSMCHDNVVRCIGVFWSTSFDIAVVEEACPLGSLYDYMTTCAGDPTFGWTSVTGLVTRLSIARDLARALKYLHCEKTHVHGQVHSESVWIAATGAAKLDGFRSATTTRVATVAPEVCAGGCPTVAADVYALGVLMCEMDHGCALEAKATSDETLRDGLQDIAAGFFRPAPTTKCPLEIAEVIASCVHVDPAQRSAAADVYRRLSEFHEYCQRHTTALLLSSR
ncbi:serine/threonine protein kinase [Saprolegnia diclina VS20]|uniref:Serine/threonine protein kinase n=1 Tax=Saprolegnia diclina (strain VS20) TaxID=1156394 RepID=T0QX34_SAPDV|nr:serine/threonine protein kinase [Saprolegnia diclina VS20]EQC42804.1 serine/threonine protein kinase [Saprolegnia diclina VS20]|eukprot:XP_008604227.1 serine/threonine protein kinase [Saprolegnia diclina VS20]